MNEAQLNEALRSYQEAAPGLNALMQCELFLLKHWLLFSVIGFCYGVLWLLLIYDDLQKEEGVDRLTWLVTLLFLPLFGSLFYFLRTLERETQMYTDDRKPGWRRSLGG